MDDDLAMPYSPQMIAEQAAWAASLAARYGEDGPELMSRYEQTHPEGAINPPATPEGPTMIDTPIAHRIVIDEETGGDCWERQFRAYCTDECGWQSDRWIHSDEFEGEDAAVAAALAAAEAEGNDHLAAVEREADDNAAEQA
jgi:hypothetical protein